MNERICEECGSNHEVIESTVWWTAWGRHAFDFNWTKNEESKVLCYKCEKETWELCSECGALIESEHYGHGYLPDDYEGDDLCPECTKKMIAKKREERRKHKAKIRQLLSELLRKS